MGQTTQAQGVTSNVSASGPSSFPANMNSVSANSTLPPHQRPNPPTNGPQATPQAAVQAQVAAREKARVSALLDINSMLLQEVMNLQAAGKAGGPEGNPSPTAEHANETSKPSGQKASQEYIECMRRLQANLAYLASIADRAKKSGGVPPTAPAIMNPPPNLPQANELYGKLNELFPRASRGALQHKSGLQAVQGNGRPSPSSASESAT